MRRKPGADATVGFTLPTFNETDGFFQLPVSLVPKDSPAKIGAHACLFHCLGDHIHFKVMIRDAGDACLDHLSHPQHGTPIDILGCQVRFKRKYDFVKPIILVDVWSGIAKEHHRNVRVGVDHTRHSQHPCSFDDLETILYPRRGRLNGSDLVVLRQDVLTRKKARRLPLEGHYLTIPND